METPSLASLLEIDTISKEELEKRRRIEKAWISELKKDASSITKAVINKMCTLMLYDPFYIKVLIEEDILPLVASRVKSSTDPILMRSVSQLFHLVVGSIPPITPHTFYTRILSPIVLLESSNVESFSLQAIRCIPSIVAFQAELNEFASNLEWTKLVYKVLASEKTDINTKSSLLDFITSLCKANIEMKHVNALGKILHRLAGSDAFELCTKASGILSYFKKKGIIQDKAEEQSSGNDDEEFSMSEEDWDEKEIIPQIANSDESGKQKMKGKKKKSAAQNVSPKNSTNGSNKNTLSSTPQTVQPEPLNTSFPLLFPEQSGTSVSTSASASASASVMPILNFDMGSSQTAFGADPSQMAAPMFLPGFMPFGGAAVQTPQSLNAPQSDFMSPQTLAQPLPLPFFAPSFVQPGASSSAAMPSQLSPLTPFSLQQPSQQQQPQQMGGVPLVPSMLPGASSMPLPLPSASLAQISSSSPSSSTVITLTPVPGSAPVSAPSIQVAQSSTAFPSTSASAALLQTPPIYPSTAKESELKPSSSKVASSAEQKAVEVEVTYPIEVDLKKDLNFTIVNESMVKVEENKITGLASLFKQTTIKFGPDLTRGIWQAEMVFDNTKNTKRCGVIASAFNPPVEYFPGVDGKSAGYWGGAVGIVFHGGSCKSGNQKWKEGDTVLMEVNMGIPHSGKGSKAKRTLHFFVNGVQQPIYVKDLPDTIRFCGCIAKEGAEMTVNFIHEIKEPTIVPTKSTKALDWES
ncbi:uncharacterized protein MONOS_10320 [Monocercomonoides exilis]|uniref:uncharacterized protein n=1 Tax=Monocercomonoides exilis TaxID=2049356 RepID=UPI00355AB813|nr:hypothetical protein MONOS_10320 [Monocercomonoides exilis]|eukprot:MONOS_10320.1-p1 / transcript=MONOS_10320.1 / gene=MONOS_10320 / organism=Monocercomonoides_exilis_PA203 / gene_product=unspecified product / transcript_product=unspecified product / location=Mono_scaffold00464:29132-31912(+) / protein_length=749 / sequence_SO=supercontig / SO=protein_coding / is_pseudo=false